MDFLAAELNFGVLDVAALPDADQREWSGPGIEHFEELAEARPRWAEGSVHRM